MNLQIWVVNTKSIGKESKNIKTMSNKIFYLPYVFSLQDSTNEFT